jgi:nucleoside-triphosphatase
MVLLTGKPGVGKTTVVSRVVLKLRTDGLAVGGVYSRERRSYGRRVGFEMVDLSTDDHETLAALDVVGPRLGKYRVNIRGLAEFGAAAIMRGIGHSDVVVCDEVGPMELMSPEFRKAVEALVVCNKPRLIVLSATFDDPLLVRIRGTQGATMIEVTEQNRALLPDDLYGVLRQGA